MSEMLYENVFEHFYSIFVDLVVFLFKSFYFIIEAIILALVPDKYRQLKDVSGQNVLITGGGGGVGRHLALNFAKQNLNVIIWDINREAIKSTQEFLLIEGYTCKGYVVDISQRENIYETAKRVKEEIGNIDIIVNNAGIVCCRTFLDLPDKVIENTFAVNILSHYWVIKSFLPDMMETERGHIVTIGSVTGLLGIYGCTDYAATKFACIGLHESLDCELKSHGYHNINLTLVCPSYINTSMFSGVKPRLMPMLEPKYVADEVLSAVRKNKVWCTIPGNMRMLLTIKSLFPSKMSWEFMNRVIKGPQSMMTFRGRGRVAAG